ncbi:MAG: response regulator [Ruminiclostridium sp.]|nr:response regulator [Ruminiclostridium sp.]
MTTLTVDDQPAVTELMKTMLTKIDHKGTHLTANDPYSAIEKVSPDTQVLFLDIEMPGVNGIDTAKEIQKRYPKLNIVFITGHPEYALQAHGLFPSGFLIKPIDEQDIITALRNLRYPIDMPKSPVSVSCSPFGVFVDSMPFDFRRDRTIELFAYLVYKNGTYCTSGELLGIMWDGNIEKDGHLRQLVKDMRDCLKEIGAETLVLKKYGKIAIDINAIEYSGELTDIAEQFGWI